MSDDDDDDCDRHAPTSSSSFISSSFEASYPVVIALSSTTSSSSITNDNIITPLIDGSHAAADDDDGRDDKDTSMPSLLFTIPLEWQETIDTMITESSASSSSSSLPRRDGHQALKVMVIGSKGSGKSSFIRVATNRYISTTIADHHHHHHHHHHNKDSCPPLVRVVDLDCGQPDVALPGTISIDLCHEVRLYPGPTSVIHNPTTTTTAGASITHHHQQQQQQLYTGACTPALNPRDYVDKCCRLMDEAMRRDEGHEGSSSSPVLVNTPGWYGGLGGHILAYLRYYIQPHIVIVLGDKQQQQEHNHYWSDLCNGLLDKEGWLLGQGVVKYASSGHGGHGGGGVMDVWVPKDCGFNEDDDAFLNNTTLRIILVFVLAAGSSITRQQQQQQSSSLSYTLFDRESFIPLS
ncbi:Polynucleotide 5'-hydroxyl-kinase grc3 [Perkinsus olseni]|uniref:Polynucleotide 5'-hydroxyl-kinase grc3 n=1 Tax=Perkinsus olseni TaxID=32597 RepID=A0A7J6PJ66_PEROL|nr:Polynucleotide 5'-hydroxyl-kinase grc3 [Perkinsus olseni]